MTTADTDVLTGAEIGRLLGVSRQRVHELSSRPGFPAPAFALPGKRLWRRTDVETWMNENGRALEHNVELGILSETDTALGTED